MVERLDAHQHFWRYDDADYPWIVEGMEVIRRDFMPTDFEEESAKVGVVGSVAVQARQVVAETQWLLDLAAANPFIAGVVGWLPLTTSTVEAHLERFATHLKLKGVRHVLQDEADPGYMLRSDFNAGVSLLHRFNLVYDILVFERHLPQTIQFVDRHPNQVFVLDHLAKPRVADCLHSPWRENITELAKRPHVFCKLSGLTTEAEWKTWRPDDLTPYIDSILEAFTPSRVMFGSDWPVLLLAASYETWFRTIEQAVSTLSNDEQRQIWGTTAAKAYCLQTLHQA